MVDSSPWDPADEPQETSATSAPAPTKPADHSNSGPSIAYRGQRVSPSAYDHATPIDPHAFRSFPDDVPIVDEDFDFNDLLGVNKEIIRTRRRLYAATQEMKKSQRLEVQAKVAYNRKHAVTLIGLSGGTEKVRQAIADLESEEEYSTYLIAQQVSNEWTNMMRTLKADLDTLAGISHNIRAQIQAQ